MSNLAENIGEDFGLDRDLVLQKPIYSGLPPITLGSIFDKLSKGLTSKQIRSYRYDILPETISLARAHIRAVNGQTFKKVSDAETLKNFSVLVDENISHHVKGSLTKIFGSVTTIHDEGMVSYKDDAVWEWSVNNRIDVILTRDCANRTPQDLSYIAEEETRRVIYQDYKKGGVISWPDLPMLLQFSGDAMRHEEIAPMIKRNKRDVFSHIDNRSAPRVLLNASGVKPFSTFLELLAKEVYLQNGGDLSLDRDKYREEILGSDLFQGRREYNARVWKSICAHHGIDKVNSWSEERKAEIDKHIKAAASMHAPKTLP